jgi:2-polyprenyl-3-methyl-5-hydroxy-6-metoxy-1,4-benzoquinol methylase
MMLLDIGCGLGQFLAKAQVAGYRVKGVESSEFACEYARRKCGLQVESAAAELVAGLPPDRVYDVITLWHVLEHLDNPFESLRGLRKAVKPGGLLAVEVPNEIEGLIRMPVTAKNGQWCPMTRPPVHLYYFTVSTLSATLEKAGHRTIHCETERFATPWF